MKTLSALILGIIFNVAAQAGVSFLMTPVRSFMTTSGLGGPIIAVVMAAAVVGYSGYLAAYLAARVVPGVSLKGYAIIMTGLVLLGSVTWLSDAGMFDQGLSAVMMMVLGTIGGGLGAVLGVGNGLADGRQEARPA